MGISASAALAAEATPFGANETCTNKRATTGVAAVRVPPLTTACRHCCRTIGDNSRLILHLATAYITRPNPLPSLNSCWPTALNPRIAPQHPAPTAAACCQLGGSLATKHATQHLTAIPKKGQEALSPSHMAKLMWVLDHSMWRRSTAITSCTPPPASAATTSAARTPHINPQPHSSSSSSSYIMRCLRVHSSFSSSSGCTSSSRLTGAGQTLTPSPVRAHRQHSSSAVSGACQCTSQLPVQHRTAVCCRYLGNGSRSLSTGRGSSSSSIASPSAWQLHWGHNQYLHTSSSSSSHSRTITTSATSSSSSSSSSSSPRLPAASEISSTANPYIKHCVKLRESARYRQQQRRLLLVGATLLEELAEDCSLLQVLVLFTRPGAALPPNVSAQCVITVTDTVMKKLTGLEEAAGIQVVAELALPDYVDLSSWQASHHSALSTTAPAPAATGTMQRAEHQGEGASSALQQQQQQVPALQRLLVLEGVQDPGNLGTLLRCAAAFGWDAVWLLPGCCDPFNDKALRASRGAALRCRLAAGSLEQLVAVVKQHKLLLLAAQPEPQQQQESSHPNLAEVQQQPTAAAAAAAAVHSAEQRGSSGAVFHRPVCLVLGTEGAGLSQQVLSVATPLAVPMSGRMESLNVGVAGAILMFALSEGLPQLLGRLQQLGQLPEE